MGERDGGKRHVHSKAADTGLLPPIRQRPHHPVQHACDACVTRQCIRQCRLPGGPLSRRPLAAHRSNSVSKSTSGHSAEEKGRKTQGAGQCGAETRARHWGATRGRQHAQQGGEGRPGAHLQPWAPPTHPAGGQTMHGWECSAREQAEHASWARPSHPLPSQPALPAPPRARPAAGQQQQQQPLMQALFTLGSTASGSSLQGGGRRAGGMLRCSIQAAPGPANTA